MPLAKCHEGKIFIPALIAKDFEIKEKVALKECFLPSIKLFYRLHLQLLNYHYTRIDQSFWRNDYQNWREAHQKYLQSISHSISHITIHFTLKTQNEDLIIIVYL